MIINGIIWEYIHDITIILLMDMVIINIINEYYLFINNINIIWLMNIINIVINGYG